jgi:hypothetical protein
MTFSIAKKPGHSVSAALMAGDKTLLSQIAEKLNAPAGSQIKVTQVEVGSVALAPMKAFLLVECRTRAATSQHLLVVPYKIKPDAVECALLHEGAEAYAAGVQWAPPALVLAQGSSPLPEIQNWRRRCLINATLAKPLTRPVAFSAILLADKRIILAGSPNTSEAIDGRGEITVVRDTERAGSIAIPLKDMDTKAANRFSSSSTDILAVRISNTIGDVTGVAVFDHAKLVQLQDRLEHLSKRIINRAMIIEDQPIEAIPSLLKPHYQDIVATAAALIKEVVPAFSTNEVAIRQLERAVGARAANGPWQLPEKTAERQYGP